MSIEQLKTTTEQHSINPFRAKETEIDGKSLGVIRLNYLAYPNKEYTVIRLSNGTTLYPKGFDTYGHPIISETAFTYYKALKANAERRGELFNATVTYIKKPFCVKRESYDTVEAINEAINNKNEESRLSKLKEVLMKRKQAHFVGGELNTFLLYGKYVLASDGHIYYYVPSNSSEEDVVQINNVDISKLQEIHIPGDEDRCAICGAQFNIKDLREGNIAENSKFEKVHKNCSEQYNKETEHQIASQIVDSVYDERQKSEIVSEDGYTWYEYTTNQGKIRIRFKRKVIVIEWLNNFKPFIVEKLFHGERCTKYVDETIRGIHAWSKDDAIRYLSMAKKA